MNKLGKTLVIGAQSYIGKQFYELYRQFNPDTLGTHYRSNLPEKKFDLLAPNIEPLKLEKGAYQWAVIAAANTNLSRCEAEKNQPFRANVEGTLYLVKELLKKEITPIILSSDYVFDGLTGGYTEESLKNPLNEYGRQKDLLEREIQRLSKGNCLIIRCSKIFGLKAGDQTLIDQIVSPLMLNQPIKAAYDQFFSPIYEQDVIAAVLKLQMLGCKGLYNLCGPEIWTRLDLARAIGNILQCDPTLIEAISLDDLKIPYLLPKHTHMNCEKFYNATQSAITPLSHCLNRLKLNPRGIPWQTPNNNCGTALQSS